ncbi:MAG: DUF3037 domain-containing protein, partial [Gemmatimonadota bacterium]
RYPYSFALLRVVPHPHTGAFVTVGVVLQSRPAAFIGLRAITDEARRRSLAPDTDTELLARYLRSCEAVAAGDASAGEIALLSPPERFHWLTAPRSDVIQASPVHSGITDDPGRTLEEMFDEHVGR